MYFVYFFIIVEIAVYLILLGVLKLGLFVLNLIIFLLVFFNFFVRLLMVSVGDVEMLSVF